MCLTWTAERGDWEMRAMETRLNDPSTVTRQRITRAGIPLLS